MTSQDAPRQPALARAAFDRAADERADAQLVARLRSDPRTRVVVVHGDRAPVVGGELRYVDADAVIGDVQWAFLGRGADGAGILVAAAADDAPAPLAAASGSSLEWGALRAVGGELAPEEAAVFVAALALGRWLVDAPYCPRCGGDTRLTQAGWSRTCAVCGREHFPRTDPAIIVAVTDADSERLLLGKNAQWASRNMFSAFAGFVEAGESLEAAIVREIEEEAGVLVHDLRYRGSQAWPYPRSLMLGFHAVAADGVRARPDGEEIVEVRWFTRPELVDAFAGVGDVRLPGAASIAHRLIRDWVES